MKRFLMALSLLSVLGQIACGSEESGNPLVSQGNGSDQLIQDTELTSCGTEKPKSLNEERDGSSKNQEILTDKTREVSGLGEQGVDEADRLHEKLTVALQELESLQRENQNLQTENDKLQKNCNFFVGERNFWMEEWKKTNRENQVLREEIENLKTRTLDFQNERIDVEKQTDNANIMALNDSNESE